MDAKQTGERLKEWREAAGFARQKDAEEALGVSQQTISAWENGEPPPVERAPAIDKAYGLAPGTALPVLAGARLPKGLTADLGSGGPLELIDQLQEILAQLRRHLERSAQ